MPKFDDELDLFDDGKLAPPSRAVAYVRQSTDDQENSPKAQRASITRTAKRLGLEVLREFSDDGVSGSILNRPGLLALIEYAQAENIDTVLLRDYTRASRLNGDDDKEFQRRLRKAGVRWVIGENETFPVANPGKQMDDLPRHFQSMMAHEFLVKQSFNVCDGLADQTAASVAEQKDLPGYSVNGEPRLLKYNGGRKSRYGYLVDKKPNGKYMFARTYKDPETRATVERIVGLKLKGFSVGRIVCMLTEEGIPSPEGKGWNATVIGDILTHPAYRGIYTWGRDRQGKYYRSDADGPKAVSQTARDEAAEKGRYRGRPRPGRNRNPFTVEDAWEPYINPAQAKRIDAMLAGAKSKQEKRRKESGSLVGVLLCQHCGRPLRTMRYKCGTAYRCVRDKNGRHYCDHGGLIYEADVLPGLLNHALASVDDAAAKLDALDGQPKPTNSGVQRLQADIKRLRTERKDQTDKLLALKAPSKPVLNALNERIQELQDELDARQNELERLQAAPQDVQAERDAQREWLERSAVALRDLRYLCDGIGNQRFLKANNNPPGETKRKLAATTPKGKLLAVDMTERRRHVDAAELRQLLRDLGVAASVTWDKSPKEWNRTARVTYSVQGHGSISDYPY